MSQSVHLACLDDYLCIGIPAEAELDIKYTRLFVSVSRFDLKRDIVSMVVLWLDAEDVKHFSILYRVGEHVIFREEQL